MTLSGVASKVRTLLPDGTVLKEYAISGGKWAHTENRIGEFKQLEVDYTSDTDLTGMNIYVLPALFYREDILNLAVGKGYISYQGNIASVNPGDTFILGIAFTTPGPNQNPLYYKNHEVRIVMIDNKHFTMYIDYYHLADVTEYCQYGANSALSCFITDWPGDGVQLTPNNSNQAIFPRAGIPSVYWQWADTGANLSPRVHTYIEMPGSFPLVSAFYDLKFFGYKAGWYNQNNHKAAPFFTNMNFVMKRGGNVVTDFSDSENTDIEIFADSGNPANNVTKVLMWVVKATGFNPYQEFFTAAEADFQDINSGNAGGTKILGPMTDPVNTIGTTWKATCKVGPLSLTDKYRLIGVVYSDNAAYKVNSFISQEAAVITTKNYTGEGFDVRASLDDYHRQFEGHDLECVIEERMRAKVKLDYAFNKWKTYIFDRLGLVTTNDLRRYLTQIEFQIFEEKTIIGTGIVKHILEQKVSNKIGYNTYSIPSGMSMEFGDNWSEFRMEWRNRFEDYVTNISTFANGILQTPPSSNQYWGGRTLKVRLLLTFIYDDYSTPFADVIIVDQQMRVKDYGGMVVKQLNEDDCVYSDVEFICSDDRVCYAGVLPSAIPDKNLIANIRPLGSNVNAVDEAENWEGDQLPQLFSDKFSSLFDSYQPLCGEQAAKFCVDGSKLLLNSQYVVSAMAKKYVLHGFRAIESGPRRRAENTDRRQIDNF